MYHAMKAGSEACKWATAAIVRKIGRWNTEGLGDGFREVGISSGAKKDGHETERRERIGGKYE